MSSINQILTMTFRVVGGNVVSSVDAMGNSFRRLYGVLGQNSTMSSRLNQQWKAFGTTLRYSIAGFGTYELYNSIGRLRDYQVELGNLNATLGESPQTLEAFGRTAIDISNRTAQPLNDVLQSMNNIATSIPNMSRAAQQHLIPAMAQIEAMGSRISGTDPKSFGATILGLATAFYGRNVVSGPHGADVLSRISSQVLETQRRIPNPQGPQAFIGALPMLTGGAVAGKFTLPEALSLFTTVQRQVLNPNRSAQYLRQLMIRIQKPTTSEQTFFNQAGLTPQALQSMNGQQILTQIMLHALTLPGANLPAGVTPQEFMRTGSWRRLHPTGASGAFLQNAIGGRIQGLVAGRAIFAGLQQLPMEIQALNNAVPLQERFNRMMKLMPLEQAQNALSNLTTSVAQDAAPAFNTLAGAATGLSDTMNHAGRYIDRMNTGIEHHLPHILGGRGHGMPTTLGQSITGGADIAAILGGGLLFGAARRRLPMLGRMLGRGRGALGAAMAPENAIFTAQAATSALQGVAKGTPGDPFWVVIHPLSKDTVGNMFGGGGIPNKPPSNGGGPFGFFRNAARAVGIGALARFGGSIPKLFGRAGSAIGGFGAEIPGLFDTPMWWPGAMNPVYHTRNAGWENFLTLGLLGRGHDRMQNSVSDHWRFLSRRFPGIQNVEAMNKAMWRGQADVNLLITREDASGRITRQRVHIPVDMWSKTGTPPSHRGRHTIRTGR